MWRITVGKKQDCPLWRHAAAKHDGRMDVKFAKKVVRKFRDPLTRQCNESVRMQRCEADVLLNSKSWWHGPDTITLQAECGRWKECGPAQHKDYMKIMKFKKIETTQKTTSKPWSKVSGTFAAHSHSNHIRDTFKLHSTHICDTFKLWG